MRASLRRAVPPLFSLAAIAACSASREPVGASVAPSVVFPRGLLDNAQVLTLDVYDATQTGAGCDPKTGLATNVTSDTPKVATQDLGTTNCTGNAKFCGSLAITKSDDTLVFAAVARSSNGAIIANGCATGVVNADVVPISIPMIRFVPPATCGNGVIEATEQCDPPGSATDLVCDDQCHSKEIVLASQSTSPPLAPSFLWPAQTGEKGRFFAFFTQDVGSQRDQIAMRVMSDALAPVTTPSAASAALLAPNDANGPFPPVAVAGNQLQPAGAFANNLYWYAFEDKDDAQSNSIDVHLRSFDHTLTAQQGSQSPLGVNGPNGAGEDLKQVAPAIALGSNGLLYIAWQDVDGPNAGQIVGRTFDPVSGTLGTENQISTGSGNENVQLAATPNGWLAAWDSGTQIWIRPIPSSGTPAGPPIVVSDTSHTGTQDHPGVAVLPSGAAAVVWCDHATANGADVFVQRFDVNLAPVAGDQAKAIDDLTSAGDQIAPSIASSSAAGGSYVAAWLDSQSGEVHGRVLDGAGGFLFNPIDGQTTEFTASLNVSTSKANPTVAIGGAGPWVAIGWNDGQNVVARRFPAPTQ